MKKSEKKRRMPFAGLVIVGIAVLAAASFITSTKQQKPSIPPPSIAAPARLGWDIADYLLSRRPNFLKDIGSRGLPEWRDFTPTYFTALKARKDAVIAWTVARPEPTPITFIGLIHVNMDGSTTPEQQQAVDQVQTAAFEKLRTHAQKASVVAIEESGSDEVMTPDIFLGIIRHSARDLYGRAPPDADILTMMQHDRQTASRAIVEGLPVPIICGEEWPLRMEVRLIKRRVDPTHPSWEATNNLIESFDVLRSEIILIRALEYLKRTEGTAATILQGAGHQTTLERVAPEYHINLNIIWPP